MAECSLTLRPPKRLVTRFDNVVQQSYLAITCSKFVAANYWRRPGEHMFKNSVIDGLARCCVTLVRALKGEINVEAGKLQSRVCS